MVYTYTTSPDVVNTLHDVLKHRNWHHIKPPTNPAHTHTPHVNLNWQTYRRGLTTTDYCTREHDSSGRHCRINHFLHSEVICKKNTLSLTLTRHAALYDADTTTHCALYDYAPTTFVLPEQIDMCKRYMSQHPNRPMILKPATGRQGKNIRILTTITDIPHMTSKDTYVCQQYLNSPYLGIGGYKFDLRIYALVRSYDPLEIYVHKRGLVRFSSYPYTTSNYDNAYQHLTNFSVNKHNRQQINTDKPVIGRGCKWTLSQLEQYFTAQDIAYHTIWRRIHMIIISTILASIGTVKPGNKSFELFGFDVMLDAALKPWLLEVNASPALATTTSHDRDVKYPMLNDLLDCIGFDRQVTGGDMGSVDAAVRVSPVTRRAVPMLHKRKLKRHTPQKSLQRMVVSTGVDTTDTASSQSDSDGVQADTVQLKQQDSVRTKCNSGDYGEFEAVYPFNDTTRNLSQADIRLFKQIAVREMKKLSAQIPSTVLHSVV